MKMSALSVRQPYASAILAGLKVEEYRSRRTLHRGPLAIHVAGKVELGRFSDYPTLSPADCPTGCILGVVDVVDCLEDVYEGWVWLLANPRRLVRPIQMKGKLGLFPVEVPDELLAIVALS